MDGTLTTAPVDVAQTQTPMDAINSVGSNIQTSADPQVGEQGFRMELPDGSVYLSQEEAFRGLQEKANYIPSLKQQLQQQSQQIQMLQMQHQLAQQQQQAQPQANPVDVMAERLANRYRVEYPDHSMEEIKAIARKDAIVAIETESRFRELQEQQQLAIQTEQRRQADFQVESQNQEFFNSPLKDMIINGMIQNEGRRPWNATELVQRGKIYCMENNIPFPGGNKQFAPQQQTAPHPTNNAFSFPNGAPQRPEPMSDYVRQALEYAERNGKANTPEQRQRIIQIASSVKV